MTQVAQVLRNRVPGIGSLRMPSGKAQSESLLQAAGTLAKQASTYQSVLVEEGLAPDFLTQLGTATAALQASVDKRGTAIAGQVSATKQLIVSLRLGTQYVQLMDAALSRTLKQDPAKLAEWKNAKRVKLLGAANGGITKVPVPLPVVGTTPEVKAA